MLLHFQAAEGSTPFVRIETNQGAFTLQLDPEKAPVTVANFLTYVNEGFYRNTLFHRSVPGFVVQGGGFGFAEGTLRQKATHAPVNEAANGLSNVRGTVAMARTEEADSATSQFYVNVVDNSAVLDYGSPPPNQAGYAVFGEVVDGMDKIDAINNLPRAGAVYPSDFPPRSVFENAPF